MKMTSLFEPLQRGLSRKALVAQKNAPQVLFVGGVVGMVGSTVLACRSTLKLESVLNEAQSNLEVAKTMEHPDYSEQDRQKDTAIIYARAGVSVAKLYAPSVVLGVASITMLTKSHNLLQDRNAALTAAYVALDNGFREYRARVVEKYGVEEDERFRYDTEVVEVSGGKNKSTKTKEHVGPDAATIYARFFDQLSQNWSREPEYNAIFLRNQQNYANDLLNARGHVFLNEVYDMLGIPHSEAGAVVGWLRSDRTDGDGYIDFGVFRPDGSDRIRDFVNGREGAVLLDFNVDGLIYNKIEQYKEAPKWQLEQR